MVSVMWFDDNDVEKAAKAIYDTDPDYEGMILDGNFELITLSWDDVVMRDEIYDGDSAYSPIVRTCREQAYAALKSLGLKYR